MENEWILASQTEQAGLRDESSCFEGLATRSRSVWRCFVHVSHEVYPMPSLHRVSTYALIQHSVH